MLVQKKLEEGMAKEERQHVASFVRRVSRTLFEAPHLRLRLGHPPHFHLIYFIFKINHHSLFLNFYVI